MNWFAEELGSVKEGLTDDQDGRAEHHKVERGGTPPLERPSGVTYPSPSARSAKLVSHQAPASNVADQSQERDREQKDRTWIDCDHSLSIAFRSYVRNGSFAAGPLRGRSALAPRGHELGGKRKLAFCLLAGFRHADRRFHVDQARKRDFCEARVERPIEEIGRMLPGLERASGLRGHV